MKSLVRTLSRPTRLVRTTLPICTRQLSVSPARSRRESKSKSKSSQQISYTSTSTTSTPTAGSGKSDAYYNFRRLVQKHFNTLLDKLDSMDPRSDEYRGFGFTGSRNIRTTAKKFTDALEASFNLAAHGSHNRTDNPLFWSLRHGFVTGNIGGLNREIKYAFRSFTGHTKYSPPSTHILPKLGDFQHPTEWFPGTRSMQRKIHLHVGPTNSGKTYNALKALESATTGVYAGPLRLLAHEVYTRMVAKGRSCALLTGEEQRWPEDTQSFISSCTVEMAPLNTVVDVAVIDEIQMIADPDRGWAWTQAVLGIQAREVHLCGEERTVDLIKRLAESMGDECIVHQYERLSPLEPMNSSLGGDLKKLQKGDAVVAFSRIGLHALKRGIEKQTGKRCAIVYGSLPPETRAEQAALFNDPDNEYDYIVASDAIGMGLNLEIRRVVFDTTNKFDGSERRFLGESEIKQIGGRAGRFRSAAQAIQSATEGDEEIARRAVSRPSVGYVTCVDDGDLRRIQKAFEVEVPPIKAAGLLPPAAIIEKFSSYFAQDTPLSHILLKIREVVRTSDDYFVCNFDDWIEAADIIQAFPMPISDRLVLLSAPLDYKTKEFMRICAKCVSELKDGHLLSLDGLELEVLDVDDTCFNKYRAQEQLNKLETLHKCLILYLWLSYRYQGVFVSQDLAFHAKSLVEEKIRERLDKVDFRLDDRLEQKRKIEALMLKNQARKNEMLQEAGLVYDTTGSSLAADAPAQQAVAYGSDAVSARL
ncbi:RNA helicase [Pyricularia oryzae]